MARPHVHDRPWARALAGIAHEVLCSALFSIGCAQQRVPYTSAASLSELEAERHTLAEGDFDARHGLGAYHGVGHLLALRDHVATHSRKAP